MQRAEQAEHIFKEGFNCAQAVLLAFGPQLGLDKEMCLKVASGYGGGMGRLAQTCGAVTGAFMVIGLKHGNTQHEDKEAKAKTITQVQSFVQRFKEKFGSTECAQLLGCHIGCEQGMQEAQAKNLFQSLCPSFVRQAVIILEELDACC